ncbi:hypothetical protein, partial [Wolbachia pipientis]|uniref:hypothetical protein n=1 Tax=Wolbachia pipientis TaxID=955 RepID=UPI001C607410
IYLSFLLNFVVKSAEIKNKDKHSYCHDKKIDEICKVTFSALIESNTLLLCKSAIIINLLTNYVFYFTLH